VSTLVANSPQAWSERARSRTSWEAAMWSESGQTRRFLAVLRHLELRSGDSVLDYGCGTGRFCAFLPPDVGYYGLDWSEEMRRRVADEHPRARVLCELPDLIFDHVVCVGTFNLADGWSREQTFAQLADLWNGYTRRTLVVSLYRGHDPSCLRYQPEDLVEFARRLGCQSFAIDATYLENDLLLELRR
jgi:SAM-dependent methyltransferase